jgi:hypothetical protein
MKACSILHANNTFDNAVKGNMGDRLELCSEESFEKAKQ